MMAFQGSKEEAKVMMRAAIFLDNKALKDKVYAVSNQIASITMCLWNFPLEVKKKKKIIIITLKKKNQLISFFFFFFFFNNFYFGKC